MLFSSFTFVFQFLPATIVAFAAARLHSARAGIIVLVMASLVFYGAWRPVNLLLLLASVAVNFLLGLAMEEPERRRAVGLCGVALNLFADGITRWVHDRAAEESRAGCKGQAEFVGIQIRNFVFRREEKSR